jgi:hypothetical protein
MKQNQKISQLNFNNAKIALAEVTSTKYFNALRTFVYSKKRIEASHPVHLPKHPDGLAAA